MVVSQTVEQAKIISLGVEKVAIAQKFTINPILISSTAEEIGNQSVVVILDVKKSIFGKYGSYDHNSKKKTGFTVVEFAKRVEKLGAGEIVINSIEQDGQMQGYDLTLTSKVREAITIPMTVLGEQDHQQILKNWSRQLWCNRCRCWEYILSLSI